MKHSKTIILPILLFVSTIFMSICYASINSITTSIEGTASTSITDVFIYDVIYQDS